ncbi:hypothetical protein Q4485_11265 [Granulosicoccaceae sp. 1_MG-2023]|nr:hypothetical protein [Granulosicoccaceae sp. 1_MG-2023]
MGILTGLPGHRAVAGVAGIFRHEGDARGAVSCLRSRILMTSFQVRLLSPDEHSRPDSPAFSRQLVTDTASQLRAHLAAGLLGALVAGLFYLGLLISRSEVVLAAPGGSLVVMLLVGVLGGLISCGLFALRPDHTLLTESVRQAMHSGRWAVVVHPASLSQLDLTLDTLQKHDGDVFRSR